MIFKDFVRKTRKTSFLLGFLLPRSPIRAVESDVTRKGGIKYTGRGVYPAFLLSHPPNTKTPEDLLA
jgi:hypothetical protein